MKKMFMLMLIILLSSCATPQKYEQKLSQQAGKTSEQLIAEFGQPNQIKQLPNGDETITYINVSKQIMPLNDYDYNNGFMDEDEMFYPFTYGGPEIPDGNFLGDTITDYCKTVFYLKNNIVTSWKFNGNACVAI